jgi:hypothetical protein
MIDDNLVVFDSFQSNASDSRRCSSPSLSELPGFLGLLLDSPP